MLANFSAILVSKFEPRSYSILIDKYFLFQLGLALDYKENIFSSKIRYDF